MSNTPENLEVVRLSLILLDDHARLSKDFPVEGLKIAWKPHLLEENATCQEFFAAMEDFVRAAKRYHRASQLLQKETGEGRIK